MTQLSENILYSSASALAFVKEFLANAAADHGFTLKITAASLAGAAAATVQHFQEAARRKKLEIQADFPAEAVAALADVSALNQVLDNLVSNALKFSPPNKRIFVSVRPAGNRAECIIRDEGPGFTIEDKEMMFHRYGRLSARPTGSEPSTGLGLSIVRKLVLAMDGELLFESVPGNGATFTVRLPRQMSD
jgi:two-component system sensor histidine kinase/response regulator